MASQSLESSCSTSSGIHYPVRKDILDKIHPGEQKKLAEFIHDLLRETSTFPLVWDPKTHHRKNWIEPSWKLIKEALQKGKWRGFNKCGTLIENAEAIFLDQRHQFYCDYIECYEFVNSSTIQEYKFLEKNAPTTSEELFRIVLEERFIYPNFSPLMKPNAEKPKENKSDDGDWSDIEDEKAYWRKLEKENEAKLAKPIPKLYINLIKKQTSSKPPVPSKASKSGFSFKNMSDIKASNFPDPEVPRIVRDWHHQVTNEVRKHLAVKIVREILPSFNPNAPVDIRIRDIINYARKMEKEMFETGNCKEEYYHLVAEKIYNIQKELQEKKANLSRSNPVVGKVPIEATKPTKESIKNQKDQEDADWSDIEAEDYWTKMARENEANEAKQSTKEAKKVPTYKDILAITPDLEATGIVLDWHSQMSNVDRKSWVASMTHCILSSGATNSVQDILNSDLINNLRIFELEMFENTNNADEYYRSMAKKTHEINMELMRKKNNPVVEKVPIEATEARKPIEKQDQDAADWSDIEAEDYWTKMAKENAAKEAKQATVEAKWAADTQVLRLMAEKHHRMNMNMERNRIRDELAAKKATVETLESTEDTQENQDQDAADWSDIEADDYWTNMAKENTSKEAKKQEEEQISEDPKVENEAEDRSQSMHMAMILLANTVLKEQDKKTTLEKSKAKISSPLKKSETKKAVEADEDKWYSDVEDEEFWVNLAKQNAAKNVEQDVKEFQKTKNDNLEEDAADWSDIEAEDYWTKMAKENAAKEAEETTKETEKTVEEPKVPREEINYDDLEEGFFENAIVPAVVAAGKKIIGFGKVIAETIKKILEDDEPEQSESNTNEPATPRHIEMDILNSAGKKINKSQEATTSAVRAIPSDFPGSAVHRSPPNMFTNTSVEEIIGLFGRVYYVNHFSKTVSLDNPLTWRKMPENWETRITENQEVYYYNHSTQVTQWNRPQTDGPRTLAEFIAHAEIAKAQQQQDNSILSLVNDVANEEVLEEDSRAPTPTKLAVEQRISKKGHIYYVNHDEKTTSMQNPNEFKEIPEGWEQKLSSDRRVYYYNKMTKITQWDRPTGESE